MCVNNLPRVIREVERLGLEPATYWLQVQCPTMPHSSVHLGMHIVFLKPIFKINKFKENTRLCKNHILIEAY